MYFRTQSLQLSRQVSYSLVMRSVCLPVGMHIARLPAGEVFLACPNSRWVVQHRLKAKHVQEVRALKLNVLFHGACPVQVLSHLTYVENTIAHLARLLNHSEREATA